MPTGGCHSLITGARANDCSSLTGVSKVAATIHIILGLPRSSRWVHIVVGRRSVCSVSLGVSIVSVTTMMPERRSPSPCFLFIFTSSCIRNWSQRIHWKCAVPSFGSQNDQGEWCRLQQSQQFQEKRPCQGHCGTCERHGRTIHEARHPETEWSWRNS